MKYLIIPLDGTPFITPFFEYENHYEEGMIVINIYDLTYTTDGKIWYTLQIDTL